MPPGGTIVITTTIESDTMLFSMGWHVHLPEGWELIAVEGSYQPEFRGNHILWTEALPTSPIHMTYTIRVPIWEFGEQSLSGELEYFSVGAVDAERVMADPLTLVFEVNDADDDGMADGWEAYYNIGIDLDPDADGNLDGMRNLEECRAGSRSQALWPEESLHPHCCSRT